MGLASNCCALIGLATARHGSSIALESRFEQADLLGRPVGLFPDRLELAPQCRELGLDRGSLPLQLPTPLVPFPLSRERRGPLAGLLGHAHRAGEDALR